MKYGVISYERKKLMLSGNDTQNLGDWVQTIAMERLYEEWGISDYIRVSRNDASRYDGEYVVLPINCFNSLVKRRDYCTETFPLSDKIIPVFVSFHLHDQYIPEEFVRQLKCSEPVGCRDEQTMVNLRRYGIRCYLSGCVTSLLRQRNLSKEYNKIVLIDVLDEVKAYIPNDILEEAEYMTNAYLISRKTGEKIMTDEESKKAYEETKLRLKYLRDNAKLVVTSRLHIASPCMAMGIPVVLVKKEFDGRFSWIDKYLKLYDERTWGCIDWNPQPVKYEHEKEIMKKIIKSRVIDTYEKWKDVYQFSEILEKREKVEYNWKINHELRQLGLNELEMRKFAIWGVVNYSLLVANQIRTVYPESELVEVFDLENKEHFEGIQIKQPSEMEVKADLVYFVIAPKAWEAARTIFRETNGKFILVDVVNGCMTKLEKK